jgi:4-amino-4-deoxychorismate lyase
MSRLIESIKLLDGRFNNLKFHEQRMARSLSELFRHEGQINLSSELESMDYPKKGLFKCRILYDNNTRHTEFIPYTMKPISSLKVVVSDTILYDHKYSDRNSIHRLMLQKNECDDILIVKNGLITDSSYANIVFKSGGSWYTPDQCLLKGTMRECLRDAGLIEVQPIKMPDILKFKKFKLINAMLGFDGAECDISNIL